MIVADPRDGSILAMASFPTFDPSAFINGISRDVFRQLQDPAGHYPLNNRAVSGLYAPGSTFKLVTALAGLRSGLVTERTTVEDKGSYKLRACRGQKCVFRNAGDAVFGTGEPSPCDGRVERRLLLRPRCRVLVPARPLRRRHPGRRPPNWASAPRPACSSPASARPHPRPRDAAHSCTIAKPAAFPNGDWYAGDNLNLAIGQGETVTSPLQLPNAYATFANGGTLLSAAASRRGCLGGNGSTGARGIASERSAGFSCRQR